MFFWLSHRASHVFFFFEILCLGAKWCKSFVVLKFSQFVKLRESFREKRGRHSFYVSDYDGVPSWYGLCTHWFYHL